VLTRSFFVRKALSLNKVLLNVSNSSVLKDFPLLAAWHCLLARVIRTQKGTSTRVSCLLNRTISHPLPVRAASGLSTSQIFKSRVVFKSQYPLICGRRLNACETRSACVAADFAWFPRTRRRCAAQRSCTSTHAGYHEKVEIHIPAVWTTNSCLIRAYQG
jgi:hypothetical protein